MKRRLAVVLSVLVLNVICFGQTEVENSNIVVDEFWKLALAR